MDDEPGRVAKAFGVEEDDLARKQRDFPPKLALYYRLVEGRGMSLARVGACLRSRWE